jgi:tetratricopeptide (TPR) repeat protein/tRNA A-37 threonylcarbamoyl transferase component Bud32
VTSLLGEGGMGTVYCAERADGAFRQRVAIKLLGANRAIGEARRRFRAEQQILANLHHEGIGRLYDGGTTADDVPYLVMEYIDGEPIDAWCDRRALGIDERIRLFLSVCAPASYAHQNLVVHRDLKPSNILVTPEGAVKLLDFGIAKLLETPLDGSTIAVTRADMRLLTPAYASPEQARGEPVTTASDVYALGVLLCQILSGALPYAITGIRPSEIERAICEEEARAPSVLCAGGDREVARRRVRARGTTPARLARRLAGDLDNIVLTALRKDPRERYGSVQELADDLERHLRGMPVRARADTWRYRSAKFVRRHRAGVAAAAALLLALVGVAATMTFQARRIAAERDAAELERARSEQLAALVERVFTASDPRREPRPDVTVRELLDASASGVEQELEDQPLVLARLLRTIGTAYLNLGDVDVALRWLGRAVEIDRAQGPAAREDLAAALARLGGARFVNDEPVAALELQTEALALFRETSPVDDARAAEVLNSRGTVLQHLERLDEAEADFAAALQIQQARAGASADVAAVLSNLAQIAHTRGDYQTAEQRYRRVLEIARATLSPADPALGDYLYNLAVLLHERGVYDEAETLYEEALANNRAAFGERHPEVATVLVALGRLHRDRGDLGHARALLEEARDITRSSYGEDHTEYAYHTVSLAVLLEEEGQSAQALALLDQAIRTYRERLPPAHAWLAGALRARGETLLQLHREAEAEEALREALSIWEQVRDAEHWRVGETWSALGAVLFAQGRVAEAEDALVRGYDLLRAQFGDDGRRTCIAAERLATFYASTGRPERAPGGCGASP